MSHCRMHHSAQTREAFLQCFAEVYGVVQQIYLHIPKDVQEQVLLPGIKLVETFYSLLQTLVIRDPKEVPTFEIPAKEEAWRPVRTFLARPEIRLIHFVR